MGTPKRLTKVDKLYFLILIFNFFLIFDRCAYKTGVLARLSARLGALLSGASEDFIHHIGIFAESIGVAFQIQDGTVSALLCPWSSTTPEGSCCGASHVVLTVVHEARSILVDQL